MLRIALSADKSNWICLAQINSFDKPLRSILFGRFLYRLTSFSRNRHHPTAFANRMPGTHSLYSIVNQTRSPRCARHVFSNFRSRPIILTSFVFCFFFSSSFLLLASKSNETNFPTQTRSISTSTTDATTIRHVHNCVLNLSVIIIIILIILFFFFLFASFQSSSTNNFFHVQL